MDLTILARLRWHSSGVGGVVPHHTARFHGDQIVIGPKGTLCSRDSSTGKVIQSVRPSDGPDMATLVGLVNIGIGLLNALEIRELRTELRQSHDQILSELRELRQLVLDVTSERREDEFARLWVGFERAKRELVEGSTGGGAPLEGDVRALQAAATSLLDGCDAQLSRSPKEAHHRLVLASAVASVTRDDLRILTGEPRAVDRAVAGANALRARLAAAALDLNNGESPWTIASRRARVAQLIVVRRSLEQRAKLLAAGQSPVDDLPVVWDDALPLVDPDERPAGVEGDVIPLRTVADFRWAAQFFGDDEATFDVRSVKQLDRATLIACLGGGQAAPLRTLMQLADRSAWRDWSEAMHREFGGQEAGKASPLALPPKRPAPNWWSIRALKRGEAFCTACHDYYEKGVWCPRCHRGNSENLSWMFPAICTKCFTTTGSGDVGDSHHCGGQVEMAVGTGD